MMGFSCDRAFRVVAVGVTALTVALGSGCIRSRLHIDSTPQGAIVTINNQPFGKTPLQTPFIWYWYYDIKVEKAGYETVEDEQYLRTPPWAYFPLDLLAEAAPFPIPDNRYVHYDLTPATEE